jgi:hypothetical protein
MQQTFCEANSRETANTNKQHASNQQQYDEYRQNFHDNSELRIFEVCIIATKLETSNQCHVKNYRQSIKQTDNMASSMRNSRNTLDHLITVEIVFVASFVCDRKLWETQARMSPREIATPRGNG